MDFFSIFQNNNLIDTNNNLDKKKTIKSKKTIPSPQIIPEEKILLNKDKNVQKEIYNNTSYKNIRKGMFVKIIGVKGSHLNNYKGYFGEIKDYKKDQDFALVFLHGIVQITIVKFPINHFIIEEY